MYCVSCGVFSHQSVSSLFGLVRQPCMCNLSFRERSGFTTLEITKTWSLEEISWDAPAADCVNPVLHTHVCMRAHTVTHPHPHQAPPPPPHKTHESRLFVFSKKKKKKNLWQRKQKKNETLFSLSDQIRCNWTAVCQRYAIRGAILPIHLNDDSISRQCNNKFRAVAGIEYRGKKELQKKKKTLWSDVLQWEFVMLIGNIFKKYISMYYK